ncbi:MAG: DUF166 family (seleno)protein DfsP [Desulfatibacillaceae bacterium]
MQKILIFQQNESGLCKMEGIERFGGGQFEIEFFNIEEPLPELLDDTSPYLPETIDADLVLDYLNHPDLSHDLAVLCRDQGVPVVASGKKTSHKGAVCPPTCCGLPRNESLGAYGRHFGAPEFEVDLEDGKVQEIRVVRGAPCGATWDAAGRVAGEDVDRAARRMGLDVQYFCHANPAGWDPIHGKSPVHFAGKVHDKALARAIEKARGQEG